MDTTVRRSSSILSNRELQGQHVKTFAALSQHLTREELPTDGAEIM